MVKVTESGGGGFFLACEDFGKMFDHSFPAYTFFFFKAEISSRTLIPLFMPGSVHSGLAKFKLSIVDRQAK